MWAKKANRHKTYDLWQKLADRYKDEAVIAGYDILNQKAEQETDPRETVAASVGQKLADVSGQTLQKNMDVQPTLIIDPGYKFKIIVMKDMVLENIEDAQGTLAYSK